MNQSEERKSREPTVSGLEGRIWFLYVVELRRGGEEILMTRANEKGFSKGFFWGFQVFLVIFWEKK